MKNLLLLVSLACGCIAVSAQTAQTLSSALQEAQKVSAEVVRLFQQKKYNEALPLAQRVIAIREKELGENYLSVGGAWRNLAYIHLQMGNQKEAERAFKNAFEIYEKNHPLAPADQKTFVELLEAAATFEALDVDIVGAEKKFQRALEIRERLFGESEDTASTLLRLAQIYQIKAEYEKSVPLLLRALDIKAKKSATLDDQGKEIYSTASCSLSKLNRTEEKDKLQERFYPRKEEKSSPDEGKTKTISGGVVNGKALNLAKPAYPAEARKNRASGTVSVQVLIDEAGKVIFACAVSGAKELQRASEAAAYQSKFSPTILENKPVKVSGIITYNFVP